MSKEKIDRQLAGQSSAPFKKLNDKKDKKEVSFDTMDALDRKSENMERMTALMDKMFLKLDKKDVPYKPQIYQKRRRGQNRQNIGQNENWRRNRPFSRDRSYNNRALCKAVLSWVLLFKCLGVLHVNYNISIVLSLHNFLACLQVHCSLHP